MKHTKLKDVQRFLISQGAVPIRQKGSHQIWKLGEKTAPLAIRNEISPGSLRDILRNLGINYKGLVI